MRKQQTIKHETKITGIGLHSGKKVTIKLKPAVENSGVQFVRVDLPHIPTIRFKPNSVVSTKLSTTIGENGVVVRTVEHLVAALWALKIDNVLVEINNEEIPIMDGSASPFVYIIKNAGIRKQDKPKPMLILKKAVYIRENGKFVAMVPDRGFKVSYAINFNHSIISRQKMNININEKTFINEISSARTFGFLEDVEYLQSHSLALGGSLDNAVVVDKYKILNEDGLRYEDEFVRHKILDAIGDISQLWYDIRGRFIAYKSGHTLNNKIAKKLIEYPDAWCLVNQTAKEDFVLQGVNLQKEFNF
ncbi:MAG: UDP-3-O-acyl-N-acetylglucosamine deacetylase [Desulfurellaceae bacterium]|jgi:UDP-3-O-[3-hydroxymyristoyl] N-acetylglucosamine deacetylase|nr:UDP-3-O-acyl-N-acetylglucosamine deacetylase [Desulfurellaceae bacterium]